MAGPTVPDFRLGDWLVEPSLHRVTRGAVVEHVRPRLVELLATSGIAAARQLGLLPPA